MFQLAESGVCHCLIKLEFRIGDTERNRLKLKHLGKRGARKARDVSTARRQANVRDVTH